jgi:hypothetical protein
MCCSSDWAARSRGCNETLTCVFLPLLFPLLALHGEKVGALEIDMVVVTLKTRCLLSDWLVRLCGWLRHASLPFVTISSFQSSLRKAPLHSFLFNQS